MAVCAKPGCPEVVARQGYCTQHTSNRRGAGTQRAYDHRRGSAASRGYGHKWNCARLVYLKAHPLCVLCQAAGWLTAATLVDHVIPHKGDMHLFWLESNWQSLCKDCHDQKTWQEVQAGMHPPSRFVVCGPPGSGKSTWVKKHARDWDVVWDWDAVASVIGYGGQPIPRELRGPHMPYAVNQAVLACRDAMVAWLESADLKRADVYFIVTDAGQAASVAKRINAEVVTAPLFRTRGADGSSGAVAS